MDPKLIEEITYYSMLSGFCSLGDAKAVSRMLNTRDKVDILDMDGSLIALAAMHGKAEVVNILIDYYIKHIPAEPGSDDYLSAIFKLTETLDNKRQVHITSFTDEIKEIFNKYIPADYEEGSDDESDFVEDDAAIAEENIHEEVAEDYSSDELPRRVSDSSDGANLGDIADLPVVTTGNVEAHIDSSD